MFSYLKSALFVCTCMITYVCVWRQVSACEYVQIHNIFDSFKWRESSYDVSHSVTIATERTRPQVHTHLWLI